MASKKQRPDAWPSDPADLPPDWVVARAPMLADLDNNAVFRLLAMRRRVSRRVELLWIGGFIAITLAVVALWISRGGIAWLLLFLALSFASPRGRTGAREGREPYSRFLMGVPNQFVTDLIYAATPVEDFIAALWGQSFSRRGIRDREIVWWGTTLLCWTLLFLPDRLPFPAGIVLLGPVALGAGAGRHRFAPETALPASAYHLASLRRIVERRRRPFRTFFRAIAIAAAATAVLIFFSFIAIQIAFFFFKSALGQALVEALRPTMRHSWLPFWGAIATAIGYGGGAWRGAYVCARAESLQRRMEKDLEFILEWLWNNFGDDAKR